MNISKEIQNLKNLHESGALTDDEFAQAKAKLLGDDDSTDHISDEAVPEPEPAFRPEEVIVHRPAKQSNTSSKGWVVPLAIVFGIFVLFYIFSGGSKETGEQNSGDNSPNKKKVKLHGTYYIFVSMVELNEKDLNGDDWDEDGIIGSKSFPDIYYRIFSVEEMVFDGKKLCGKDSLIEEWDGYEGSIIKFLKRESEDRGTTLRDFVEPRTHLVSIEKGKTLTVIVYDDDVIGDGDIAGAVPLDLWKYNVGETELWQTSEGQWRATRPAPHLMTRHGIKRIKIRIFDSKKIPEFLSESGGVPLEEIKAQLGL